jgi:hypothetical protein
MACTATALPFFVDRICPLAFPYLIIHNKGKINVGNATAAQLHVLFLKIQSVFPGLFV